MALGCRPDRGHVKLLLEIEGGATISFTRAIASGRAGETYVSIYSIDDKQVAWGAYEAKLSTFGILVKARNFLVFQVSSSRGHYLFSQAGTSTVVLLGVARIVADCTRHKPPGMLTASIVIWPNKGCQASQSVGFGLLGWFGS